jgi:hypothetical protein
MFANNNIKALEISPETPDCSLKDSFFRLAISACIYCKYLDSTVAD